MKEGRSIIRQIQIPEEIALEFTKRVRQLNQGLYDKTHTLPPQDVAIDFSQEVKKVETHQGESYFLTYTTVVKALGLAELCHVPIEFIDMTLGEECDSILMALKEDPEDMVILTQFSLLVLFLETLRKDTRLKATSFMRITELYLLLRRRLFPEEATSVQLRINSPESQG